MINPWAKQEGFTIIELLIVIVIIAILAAITIVAYNGVQARAKAASMEGTFKSVEKGMRLYGVDQGWSTWPLDTQFTGSSNPKLSNVIASTDLKNYVQSAALPDGYIMMYDNDGDTYNGCSNSSAGVKLFAYSVAKDLAQTVDDQIDDGNLSCGRVTWSSTDSSISYYLSNGQSF